MWKNQSNFICCFLRKSICKNAFCIFNDSAIYFRVTNFTKIKIFDEIASRFFLGSLFTCLKSLFKGNFLCPRFLNLVKNVFWILKISFLMVLHIIYFLFRKSKIFCSMLRMTTFSQIIHIFVFCFLENRYINYFICSIFSFLKIKGSINPHHCHI